MIAIAIFLTYCLQFYVPMNIIWSNIRDKFPEKNKQVAEYATRFSLIVSVERFHSFFIHLTQDTQSEERWCNNIKYSR